MCNWYEYDIAEWEIRDLVGRYSLVGHRWREPTGVFPNRPGAVVVDRGAGRAIRYMLWGLTPGINGRWVTNFRHPEREPWKTLVETKGQRCVVPATRFAKPDRTSSSGPTSWRWFARPSHNPFMFAGVWTTWHGDRGASGTPALREHQLYSIMTTEANADVKPVSDAMPVVLTTMADVEQWLTGSAQQALALQKPAADGVLRLLPEEKQAA